MSTMYSRSVAMLEQSKKALSCISIDEAYMDIACFETQQAIEFLLKAILLENGVAYDKSHNIRYLLSLVQDTGFTFDKINDLDNLADTITDWEQGSIYGKGIRTTAQTIQRIHNIYKNLNETFIKTQEKNNK